MANLKQILQSNNTKIANAINEQNSQIKNYIDNKDNDTIESAKRYADNLKKISGTNASMGITEDGYGIEISSDMKTTIKSIGTESSINLNAPHITVSQSPTNDNEIANKQYIDKQIMELGTAAYTNTENYDPAGSANLVKIELIGSTTNTATDNTIYGVKKYVDEQVAKIPDDVITEDKLVGKGYLVTIPDEYITETELKSELSEYAKLDNISPDGDIIFDTEWESIKNKPNYINNLADEANEQTILITNQNFSNNNIAKQSDLQDLSDGVDSRFANIATDYLKKENIEQDYIKKSNGLEKNTDNTWTIGDNAVYINPMYGIELSTSEIQLSASNSLSLSGTNGININNDIILKNNSSIKDENGNILLPYISSSSLQSYQYYIPNIKFANDDSAQINAPLIWEDTIANTAGFIFASGQGNTLMLDFPIVFREDEFNTDNLLSKRAYKAHLIKLPEFFTAPHSQISMEYFVKIYRTSKNNETTITFISKPKLYKNTTYNTIEQDTYQNHLFLDLSSFKPESFPKADSNNNKYSVEDVFMEIHCINVNQTLIESN